MMNRNASTRPNGFRSFQGRRLAPMIEAFERRTMLDGATGYLAGTVYFDSNSNGTIDTDDAYLPGARIDLTQAGSPTVIASTTTDANGGYSFQGLAPGNYVLTETPPANDQAVDARAISQVNPASKLTINSIAVTVVDPNQVYVKTNGIEDGLGLLATDSIYGESEGNNIGPLGVNFGTSPGASNLGSGLTAFCLDDLSSLSTSGGETFRVIPSNITSLTNGHGTTIPSENAGRIAFLYNHFGNSSLTNIQAPALQLAIWELIYDQTSDLSLTSGNYQVVGPLDPSDQARFDAVVQQAESYLTLSAGKSEFAMFLDAATPASTEHPLYSQSLIASSSFDFLNKSNPTTGNASIAGNVYVDSNNNGIKESGEAPIPGTTITLTGTDTFGQPVDLTTVTDGNGAYSFNNLQPGTYTLTETQPSGYLDGKDTQGTPGTGTTGNDVFSNITLAQGVNGTDNNFGELLPASIAGFVYVDANNNGIKETNEAPIPGTTISLTGTDDLGSSVTLSTTTDSNGAYSFNNLRPGTYTINETQPSGYLDGKDTQGTPGTGTTGNDVFSNITLAQNVNGINNNFGELLPASIAGFVYVDANNNGIKEAGESPIPGTTVTLMGTDDLGSSVSLSTTTDSNGAYSFNNLRPGTYTLTETQPSGYLDGKDTQGTPGTGTAGNDVFSNITLAQNVNGINNNFGELLPASIAGFVYVDANNNGIKEAGESPIPGTTVTLTGTDDLGSSVSLSATTDSNGAYSFNNLRPGTYTINETQPSGYLDGKDTQGTPGTGTTGNDVFSNITLAQNVNGINNNFGELLPGSSSIAGFVYVDANNNGVKEAGESPIPGTTVTLTGTDNLGNSVSLSTTTDSNGAYSFNGLRPGTYTLTETQPSGYLDGKDTQGTPGTGTAGNDVFSNITLAQNVNGINNNFGELLPASIAGFVYVDANNNGIKEAGELPIPGTTVTLTGTNDLGAVLSLTATTDSNGAYSFNNLRPGTYTINETQPAGFNDGKDTQGTPGTGTTGNDVFSNITLAQGVNGINNNFGELLPGTPVGQLTTPVVETLVLNGIHHQQSTVVITLGGSIDPTAVVNSSYYRLTALGKDQRLGTADDRVVPINAITYNVLTGEVTITPAYHLDFHYHYLLEINIPATSQMNNLNYSEVFGRSSMVIWDYHGRWITPPKMTNQQLAADARIKALANKQLAIQAAKTNQAAAIRAYSVKNGRASLLASARQAAAAKRAAAVIARHTRLQVGTPQHIVRVK